MKLYEARFTLEAHDKVVKSTKAHLRVIVHDQRDPRTGTVEVHLIVLGEQNEVQTFHGTRRLIAAMPGWLTARGLEYEHRDLLAELARVFLS